MFWMIRKYLTKFEWHDTHVTIAYTKYGIEHLPLIYENGSAPPIKTTIRK